MRQRFGVGSRTRESTRPEKVIDARQMAAWQAWQDKAGEAIAEMGAPVDHLHTVTASGSTAWQEHRHRLLAA